MRFDAKDNGAKVDTPEKVHIRIYMNLLFTKVYCIVLMA